MKGPICFLLISVGGAGAAAIARFRSIAESRTITNVHLCMVDTDEKTAEVAEAAGVPFFLASARGPNAWLGDCRLETARRFPHRFGPHVRRFFDAFDEKELTLAATDGGASTRPFIGSIKFVLSEDGLRDFLRSQINAALERGFGRIATRVVGSLGGGTSAPGIPFVCNLLGDDRQRDQLSPDIHKVEKPSIIFLPPYIQAEKQETPSLRYRALANAYAAIWEMNKLASERKVLHQHMLHTSNDSGAYMARLDEAAEFMADVLASQIIGFDIIQSRAKDSRDLLANEPGRGFDH